MAVTLTFDQALDILRSTIVASVRSGGHDLTQRQLAVMLLVYRSSTSRTVRELADLLAVGKPAISRALDRLEAFGLVRRMPDVRDRRSVVAGRTVAGAVYLRELADCMVAAGETLPE